MTPELRRRLEDAIEDYGKTKALLAKAPMRNLSASSRAVAKMWMKIVTILDEIEDAEDCCS